MWRSFEWYTIIVNLTGRLMPAILLKVVTVIIVFIRTWSISNGEKMSGMHIYGLDSTMALFGVVYVLFFQVLWWTDCLLFCYWLFLFMIALFMFLHFVFVDLFWTIICSFLSDISKRFREKDSQIIDAKTTINRLEGRIHNMELSAKKAKAEMEEELERFKRKQLRDKELVCCHFSYDIEFFYLVVICYVSNGFVS